MPLVVLRLLLAMALAATNLTNGAGHPAGTTQATASITPAANALVLAWVSQHSTGATPGVPTCAGNGLTWVQVSTVVFSPAVTGVSRLTCFRAMGAAPTTGAVTFTWAAQPAEGACWSIDQWTGADTSGTNGSGAIVQSATNTGTTSALSVTLAAITLGNSVTGGFANDAATGSTANTVGAGFTALANTGFTVSPDNDGHILTEWILAAQTTVNGTAGSFFQGWGGIAIEIRPPVTFTYYLSNPVQGGANAGFLTTVAPTASTSTTGWTVGSTAINQYSRQTYNSEVATTGFTSTAQPSGSPVNLGEDCFRSAATTGTFSAGTWYSSVSVLAVSSGGIQQGRGRFRLWRSTNADGTGATEITQGTMIGSQVTELSTTVAQTSSASTQISALTLTNEFLFHQIAWETL